MSRLAVCLSVCVCVYVCHYFVARSKALCIKPINVMHTYINGNTELSASSSETHIFLSYFSVSNLLPTPCQQQIGLIHK